MHVSAAAAAEQGGGVRPLRVVILGHVDHGKSTLVGRLFYETDSLPDGRYEAIQEMCRRRAMPFEWAFLTDALQAERDQGVTIDTTQIWFRSSVRDYVLIDAPGHREFLKNMVTGAASADAVVLLVDAAEGVREQSRRHIYLAHLLGIRHVIVVINKMDRALYDQKRFDTVATEMTGYLQSLGMTAQHCIPVSAQNGDNIVSLSDKTSWYQGASLLEALDSLVPLPSSDSLPLRFQLQDVYKFDERRILVGRIESGTLSVGDTLIFSPSGLEGVVASFESWPEAQRPSSMATSGSCVGVTLAEQIFVERGMVGSHPDSLPRYSHVLRASLFWLAKTPMCQGKIYHMRIGPADYAVELGTVERVIDTNDLSSSSVTRHEVGYNMVAEVILRSRSLMALDDHQQHPLCGRFVLRDGHVIAGGGLVHLEGLPFVSPREVTGDEQRHIYQVAHRVGLRDRAQRNHHRSGVVWLTGLSGAGKSTLALELERRLFLKGRQVYVLDGDNLRHGLNKDLQFTPEDRAENIRRVSEVAALMSDAGFIVIAAFIAPYHADRVLARNICAQHFHEVYIKADLATCESRDPKGLYKKARAGVIKMFSGISAPYEVPDRADLVIDTMTLSQEESVSRLMAYVEKHFSLSVSAS